MKKPLTKWQLIDIISENTNISKEDTRKVLEELILLGKQELNKGNSFAFPGIGSVRITQRKARKGINPRTGEVIQIAPRKVITFRPSISLKQEINKEDC